ncbi:hypothetical protein C6501_09110 [Candidatus Poribacteria bacterium]|nr:MAG: hypothetical protein C6501_09110 [Candidatus Poribacteria bacterium]
MANESLRQQLALLYQLQEHDRELLSFHQRLQTIPRHIAQLEATVTKYREDITAKSDELAEVEKGQRSKNAELEMNEVQREKYRNEQREVTSNDAYTALQNQIEFLDEKDSETEEEILELMEKGDQLKAELEELEADIARENEKTSEKTSEFRSEQKNLEAQINKKLEERNSFLPKIDKKLSTQYHRWRERHKTNFIALGKNGTCESCRLTIQPQNLKEAQKYEKLVYCSSCKRLLYVEPADPNISFP